MNATRPNLLFHCQHSLGMGHLVRSFALCRAFAAHYDVVLLSGGTMPDGIACPDEVELVNLPALHADVHFNLHADDGRDVETVFADRTAILLDTLRAKRPTVVVVEFYPFGRKKFAVEIDPLLRAAREQGALTVCSLRDILVSRNNAEKHDERASVTANELLDVVLVHTDERLAKLEDTFHPRTPLSVPTYSTGFVVPERPAAGPPVPASPPRVVVSVGGGAVGDALLDAAMDAQPILLAAGIHMRMITGPLVPPETWNRLAALAADRPGLELIRVVPDLIAELREAIVSVSQCGYNTALDVIRAGVPAVLCPLIEDGDEETRRARRFAELGLANVVEREQLTGAALATAILAARDTPPATIPIELDGATRSAETVVACSKMVNR